MSRFKPYSANCHEAQAAVDVATRLVLATAVAQEPNNKQEVEPMLEEAAELPEELGNPEVPSRAQRLFQSKQGRSLHGPVLFQQEADSCRAIPVGQQAPEKGWKPVFRDRFRRSHCFVE